MFPLLSSSWKTAYDRCCHLSKLPQKLSSQPPEDRDDTSRKWEDVEAWVHPLSNYSLSQWCVPLPMRPCQNRRRGRDTLDGQGLWLLRPKSSSFVLLPAANLHHKDQRRGHLLLHGQLFCNVWMESQLDGSDTRSDSSFHTCITMISNIAMIDRTYRTNAKKQFLWICTSTWGVEYKSWAN